MQREIHFYWQEACASAAQSVAETLKSIFPVNVIMAAALEPTRQAFDTSRGQYDAAWLLRELPGPDAIWLIKEDLTYTGHDFLYGAARLGFAVVSSARIGFGEDLHKEACHELGHLLGLEHCSNSCLMNPSQNKRKLAAKPLLLCPACYDLLR